MVNFVRNKMGHMRFGELLFLQSEAFAMWLCGGIPGFPGFVIRFVLFKLLFKRLGGFCWVQPGVTFAHSNRLRVGKFFGCNTGSYINAVGEIVLGDYVLFGSNVTVSSGVHPIDGKEPPVIMRATLPRRIVIEDDVWLGAGAVVMPGVTIRRGSVIGANAVVTRDTEEYGVYAGAPARKIRSRLSAAGSIDVNAE